MLEDHNMKLYNVRPDFGLPVTGEGFSEGMINPGFEPDLKPGPGGLNIPNGGAGFLTIGGFSRKQSTASIQSAVSKISAISAFSRVFKEREREEVMKSKDNQGMDQKQFTQALAK